MMFKVANCDLKIRYLTADENIAYYCHIISTKYAFHRHILYLVWERLKEKIIDSNIITGTKGNGCCILKQNRDQTLRRRTESVVTDMFCFFLVLRICASAGHRQSVELYSCGRGLLSQKE